MSKRFLVFYAIALVGVLTLSYFQNLYYPAVPSDAQSQQTAEGDLGEETADPNPSDSSTESTGDSTQENTANNDQATAADETDSEVDSDDAEMPVKESSELYSIGSLDPESPYRFLVTLDSAGATVRRVELNFRDRRNRHRYRDLEYSGGYLGELDCVNTVDGCRIRVVGDGTPAFAAGVQQGDVIKSLDGEPVVSADDFRVMLENTKPGQQVALAIKRDESEIECLVELTDKPIELLRPQPDILQKGWPALPSFRTTLRQYSPQKAIWPELDPAMRDGNWKLGSIDDGKISFDFSINSESIKDNSEISGSGITGPFTVKKTYHLPNINKENPTDFARDFHLNFDLEIVNDSDKEQPICYQIDGPLGTPSETWWYQNKIHGDNWAFLKTAGARDIVGSTGQEDFTFFGCPAIVSNLRKTEPEFFWVLSPPADNNPASQQVNYLSVDTQYFNVSLLPTNQEQPFTAYSVMADTTYLGGDDYPKDLKEQKLVDVTFRLYKDLTLKPQEKYSQSFEVFCGPKESELLEHYELGDVRTFGWFSMFSKPLCWLLKLFHTLTFQMGYGIPIILLTMLVRSLMIPVSRKAALNAQMMQYLQPQMKEIADKYKDDMEKRGQAQRDLFKKYNYNPFSGCLMMFVQLPIFIGLYRGLSVDIALRDQPLLPGLGWCSNLSAPDQFWYWKDYIPINFLTGETGWLGPYLNILPIITCVLFVIQQKMFTPPPTDEQQEMMQKVMKYAMIFMGLLFFKVPAGLCLYFITSSLWGIIERKMLPKPELDTSKLDNISGDASSSAQKKFEKQKAKAALEEQRRSEQQEEKKRRDKERKKKLKQRGV